MKTVQYFLITLLLCTTSAHLQAKTVKTVNAKLHKQILNEINIFEKAPLSESARKALSTILAFAEESEDVIAEISVDDLPWLEDENKTEYSSLLLGAFVAGNLKAQLIAQECKDKKYSGLQQVVSTYTFLRQHKGIAPIPGIEKMCNKRKESKTEEQALRKLLTAGIDQIKNKMSEDAITSCFNPALKQYKTLYKNEKRKIFCARTSTESLLYLLDAASKDEAAIVLSSTWAELHFYKAYALVETGNMKEAHTELIKAIKLSPHNAHYLSELGYTYLKQKKWDKALEIYKKSADATEFSPDKSKAFAKGRAYRGSGYALIELGRLDEAEDKYKQCLLLNVNDKKAAAELRYIKKVRKSQK